jgi:hypothetical protein
VLFVRVRDDDGRLVTRVERSEREQRIAANVFDSDAPLSADEVRAAVDGVLEQVRVELESNVEAASDDWDEDSSATTHRCSATCERHWLCFDIWQRGHVNTEALVRGVVDHVRRALNAFVLETYLLCARPRVCSPFWVRSVQRLTLHAVDLGSEAFTDVDLPLALATHAVVPFARDVAARIPDIVPALQATIYRMPGVAAGGAPLDELQPLHALDPLELGRWRAEPWRDANEAPRLLVATMLAERGVLVGKRATDEPMMYDSVKLTAADASASVQQFHRRPFVMACVSRDRIRIVTYNWRVDRNAALREASARWRAGSACAALRSTRFCCRNGPDARDSQRAARRSGRHRCAVPTLEPMLFGSAPPMVSPIVSAPPSLPSFDVVAQSDKADGAVAPTAGGAGAADGAAARRPALRPVAADDKKAPVADSTINDLIAIGGNVVRRVSSRHDMVAAAMAARRRGIAFGPSRGGGGGAVPRRWRSKWRRLRRRQRLPTAAAGATGASGARIRRSRSRRAAARLRVATAAVATSSAAAACGAQRCCDCDGDVHRTSALVWRRCSFTNCCSRRSCWAWRSRRC